MRSTLLGVVNGVQMTPRERKDVPWLAALGTLVAFAIIAGVVIGWR